MGGAGADSKRRRMAGADSEDYFTSYQDLDVHKLMLEDHPRNYAYKKAILDNKPYFKGKVVMDVGCGSGVLSVLCAQAGARKVYAVEASDVANLAREIVKENQFESVIEVIHNKVEDVALPSDEKVDIIVSEWMGFYLLHEGMLDSVLAARDKFLKEDGQMFPESATIYVAPCSVPSFYEAWSNVHGVSMAAFGRHLRLGKCNKPEVLQVKPEHLLSEEEALCWINLKEDKVEDLNEYTLKHVVGTTRSGLYQGICVWFDCLFPDLSTENKQTPVLLSTSPLSSVTHWKQTVIVLPEEQSVEQGEPIAFELNVKRAEDNCRRYNLQVTLLDPEEVEHPTPCTCHMTKCIVINKFMQQHPEKTAEASGNTDMLLDAEHYSGSDSDD